MRPSTRKDKGTNKLNTLHSDYDSFATSGMTSQIGTRILKGRPFVGTGFLFHKRLSNCIRACVDIKYDRITVLELNTNSRKILLVNVYMPYFIAGNNDDQYSEYLQTLAFVRQIILSHPFHQFIIMMDFNCNIFKKSHPYSLLINDMMNDHDLISNYSFIPGFDPDDSYTRFDLKRNSYTLIDGILISRSLSDIVVSSSILHPHINTSDHLPVQLQISVEISEFNHVSSPVTKYIPWSSLNDTDLDVYRESMSNALRDIPIPFFALNHNSELCDNCDCTISLELFYKNIVEAVEIADRTLPRKTHGLSKPYWSPHLSELKRKSFDAHKLWVDCNRPKSGPIFDEKMRTNYQYKLSLRKSKNSSRLSMSDDLSNNLLNKDHNNFWKSWKNQSRSRVAGGTMINGYVNNPDIASAFADSYKSIYTPSVANDDLKLKFQQKFASYISDNSNERIRDYLLSWQDIVDITFGLKVNKATSTFMKAEHIFCGCPELMCYIHLLFNGLISHSYLPFEFLCGTISPIVKDSNGDTTKSSNYRPITLGPVLLQLFENALLRKFGSYLSTDDLQFAYKRRHSTSHAIFALKSCVEYFTTHGSNVFVTFLDCSKAFDTISHYGIFIRLMERGVPICFLKIMIYWYLNMKSRCRWNDSFSEYFDVLSGMKQGGVLSPRIFTLYVNELIIRLRKRGVGCHLISYFIACIMFADDLCLMAPSRGAMQQMLLICEQFCDEFCLSFNTKKSKLLVFGKKTPDFAPLLLNKESIELVTEWKYLGCTIISNNRGKFTISNRSGLCSFYGSSNSVLRAVCRPNELVLMKLLYSICVPSLTYCAEVKDLSSSEMHDCNVALNNSIRHIFSYNRWESTRHLRQLLGYPNIYEIFQSRRDNFLSACSRSQNGVILFLSKFSIDH